MGFAILLGTAVAIFALSRVVKHRADDIDAVYPPEQGSEPPVFDAGSYLGGDRGMG
jgi:hypothetical protein